jgi:hypothetical protein
MPDYLGNIPVPEIAPSGVFPLAPDYPHGRAQAPEVAIHQFGSGNAKIEQRFWLGAGAKRFTVRKARLREADRIALRDFWKQHYGPYGAFTYNAPNDDGLGTTAYTCRFANGPLSWEMLGAAACPVGVTLIEIPSSSPSSPATRPSTSPTGAAPSAASCTKRACSSSTGSRSRSAMRPTRPGSSSATPTASCARWRRCRSLPGGARVLLVPCGDRHQARPVEGRDHRLVL